MNRNLDLEIAKTILGWKPCNVGPDYDGKNRGIVYTENGLLPDGYVFPPKGKLHEGFMTPNFSSNMRIALELAKEVSLKTPFDELPNDPEQIARMCLNHHNLKTCSMPEVGKIGKGKKMSIAKAALIVYFDEWPEGESGGYSYFCSGDLDLLHKIIDVADAKHAGPGTHHQVLSRINSSSYWVANHKTVGWGGRRAFCYTPSEKGKKYYEQNLKNV